jgi:hypothetical protein
MTKTIKFVEEKDLQIHTDHIPGIANSVTDLLSYLELSTKRVSNMEGSKKNLGLPLFSNNLEKIINLP